MKPNLLDRIVGWFSPTAELRRAAARMRIQSLYEGARTGRRTAGWIATNASANAEIASSLAKLRERSRDLIRNHHYAAKAAQEWRAKTVGAGILARISDERVQAAWEQWRIICSADGFPHLEFIQSIVAQTVFESGECLVRFRRRDPRDGINPPLQLQVLEPDYLDMDKTQQIDGGYIIQGVQFDLIGRRVGYWLFGQHPGEVVLTGVRGGSLQSAFVPASEVLHIYEPTRPGQVRGVPRLAPVMLAMRDMDDWHDAEIVRKKTEACLAGFITSPDGEAFSLAQQALDEKGNVVETFEPGMIVRLKPGEDIRMATPAHAGGLEESERVFARKIAAGIGMPYEILTGNLSTVNYSSYRAGLLSFRDIVTAFQWNVLIPQLCEPVMREFLRALAISGARTSGVTVKWTPPAFDLLDRETEAKADEIMLRLGTMTWAQAVARQGEDPEQQLAEIEQYAPRVREALGLSGGQNGSTQSAV
jgi:lambda family phage portal protein